MSQEKKINIELSNLNNSKQLGKYRTKSNQMYLKKMEKLYTEPNQIKRKISIKNTKGDKTIKQKE